MENTISAGGLARPTRLPPPPPRRPLRRRAEDADDFVHDPVFVEAGPRSRLLWILSGMLAASLLTNAALWGWRSSRQPQPTPSVRVSASQGAATKAVTRRRSPRAPQVAARGATVPEAAVGTALDKAEAAQPRAAAPPSVALVPAPRVRRRPETPRRHLALAQRAAQRQNWKVALRHARSVLRSDRNNIVARVIQRLARKKLAKR